MSLMLCLLLDPRPFPRLAPWHPTPPAPRTMSTGHRLRTGKCRAGTKASRLRPTRRRRETLVSGPTALPRHGAGVVLKDRILMNHRTATRDTKQHRTTTRDIKQHPRGRWATVRRTVSPAGAPILETWLFLRSVNLSQTSTNYGTLLESLGHRSPLRHLHPGGKSRGPATRHQTTRIRRPRLSAGGCRLGTAENNSATVEFLGRTRASRYRESRRWMRPRRVGVGA